MKKLFVATCGVIILTACQRAPGPAETIGDAYNSYINILKSGRNPLQSTRTELRRYLTDQFITSIDNMRPELEASPFSDPQTFDANIAIQDVATSGQRAKARVTLAGRFVGKHRLNVYLLKQDSSWKIDDVKEIEAE